ncbi:MAG: 3-dehydroquinate synthase [archaeon]
MSELVKVQLKKNSYDIIIGCRREDIINRISESISAEKSKIAIIADANVAKLYAKYFLKIKNSHLFSFEAGEKSKNRNTKAMLEDSLLKERYGKDSLIVALGGGVTGDLAGFGAATYMRGISYIQVPTTFLAMIDSSVGGKTGVNTRHGKNLIGAIYQPKAVYIDPIFLDTLPVKEFKSGLGELVKYGLLNKDFFYYIEKYSKEIIEKNPDVIMQVIKKSCQIKARIVKKDEKEKSLRQILNLGHTIGHAIEQASGYKLSHGECVAIGLYIEAKISNKLGYLEEHDLTRIKELLKQFGLISSKKIEPKKIMQYLSLDKKSVDAIPRFVLLSEIGAVKTLNNCYSHSVPKKIILEALL